MSYEIRLRKKRMKKQISKHFISEKGKIKIEDMKKLKYLVRSSDGLVLYTSSPSDFLDVKGKTSVVSKLLDSSAQTVFMLQES